ncbi:MAG: hypothetical protein P1V97_21365 [Planctomycetota bacterium]|nr:hypothetical protein [Planctomycetota bacterium]
MDSLIVNILNDVFFEFPSAEQSAQINNYAESMPQRLAAVRQVQELEDSVVDRVIAHLQTNSSEFINAESRLWKELPDQLALVSRVCAQATILGNLGYIDEKIMHHFKYYIEQCRASQALISSSLTQLGEEYARQLDPANNQFFQPYLARCVSTIPSQTTLAV